MLSSEESSGRPPRAMTRPYVTFASGYSSARTAMSNADTTRPDTKCDSSAADSYAEVVTVGTGPWSDSH
jgi:hypothetical protein